MDGFNQLPTLINSFHVQVIGEVALAMVLGGLIGIERELADKPAGFRTHMMIAGAAALLVGLGHSLLETFLFSIDNQGIRSDPMRIVEAVVTGVSFLGAGTIFRRETSQVQGLTTAASILLTSAIGICVALSEYTIAMGVTLLTLFVLRGLKFIERWIVNKNFNKNPQSQTEISRLQQDLKEIRKQLSATQDARVQAEKRVTMAIALADAERKARQKCDHLARKRLAQIQAVAEERDRLFAHLEKLTDQRVSR
jgi:putative Mg2+ transporter-C (MgtC) family protein